MVTHNRSGRLNINVRRKAQEGIVILVLKILHDAWPSTVADKHVYPAAHEDSITNVLRWNMDHASAAGMNRYCLGLGNKTDCVP